MNRKFFSGLLLLTLATGGVGTFTSCTDHEQDFRNEVLADQKDIAQQIADIRAWIGEANLKDYDNLDGKFAAELQSIKDRLKEIENKNIGQQNALDELVKDLKDIFARYAKNHANDIKSIIVERTYNPVFGTLNLPMGIESNMLINYYAKPVAAVSFPSGTGVNEDTNNDIFTPGYDLPIASTDLFTLGTGEVKIEKYGDLYMTINPLEMSFNGQSFTLVNSKGESLPAKFIANTETDYLASFGYTRANNGFYKATIAPAEGEDKALVDATEFKIEDGLTSAFKDIVKNHGKEDFAKLAKAIYSQFNGKLPAYAVKVSWKEDKIEGTLIDTVPNTVISNDVVDKSVISGYDLAVATFYPLSYTTNALNDIEEGINKRLPLIGSLQSRFNQVFNYLHNHLTLGLSKIKVDDISINLSEVTVNVKMDKVEIDLSGCPVYKAIKDDNGKITANPNELVGVLGSEAKVVLGYNGNVEGVNSNALDPLVNSIKSAIEEMLSGKGDNSLTAQINSQLKEQIGKIVDQVNKQLESVQNKVYDSLTSIQKRVNAELNGTLGNAAQSLVNLYDAFAKRVNHFLEDPSFYLQSVMAYEAVDGSIHHLSTVKEDPTYVAKGAMKFFMTSYNAELIVPAFKKYVAIVKVDDANADAALNSKAGIDLNKVLSGRQQTLGFNSAALESDKTYALFYQTLDFRGHTSSHVYYIRVK